MAEQPDVPVQTSLVDRLIDLQPDSRHEAAITARQSVGQLRSAVRRDLEALLNTRAHHRSWSEALGEIGHSIVAYGLPERNAAGIAGENWRERLRAAIEDTVRTFEPRLTAIAVTVVDNAPGATDRSIRFRIEATIQLSPAPEPVTYDSQFDPATNVVLVADR